MYINYFIISSIFLNTFYLYHKLNLTAKNDHLVDVTNLVFWWYWVDKASHDKGCILYTCQLSYLTLPFCPTSGERISFSYTLLRANAWEVCGEWQKLFTTWLLHFIFVFQVTHFCMVIGSHPPFSNVSYFQQKTFYFWFHCHCARFFLKTLL